MKQVRLWKNIMVNDMKVWVNKCIEENREAEFQEAVTFNINIPGVSGKITSNIYENWYQLLGVRNVSEICEDLYIVALSVFAADKRISRTKTTDNWTRSLHISIPVIEKERWDSVNDELGKMLSYLSGDVWKISFRRCSRDYRYMNMRRQNPVQNTKLQTYEIVSLFSGGLDSYCGAYEFMNQRKNTIFVSYKEYGKLEPIQKSLINNLDAIFPDVEKLLFTFTARAYAPIYGESIPAENTSRSRSFLFLCAAICIADIIGDEIPVYIPENGFIGLNLPMTPSRIGSCSTRTTHPHFIRTFNQILTKINIAHTITNPYAFQTKREMVKKYAEIPGFLEGISKTISCSHPCNGRWLGRSQPGNCGYCYPCLIRQSSLLDVEVPNEKYSYDVLSYEYLQNATNARSSDLMDLLSSISLAKKSSDNDLLKRINRTGRLTREEASAFLRLYKATISDLIQLFSHDADLMRIMGVPNEID